MIPLGQVIRIDDERRLDGSHRWRDSDLPSVPRQALAQDTHQQGLGMERVLREIRRRTQVIGVLPDGESALNLEGLPPALHSRIGLVDPSVPEHETSRRGPDAVA